MSNWYEGFEISPNTWGRVKASMFCAKDGNPIMNAASQISLNVLGEIFLLNNISVSMVHTPFTTYTGRKPSWKTLP